jgi:hypothetical protein
MVASFRVDPPIWRFAAEPKSTNPVRRLKTFEEVVGPAQRVRRRIKVDPKSDASPCPIPIPKNLPDQEKWSRIFQMCETVEEGMKEDDVILLGMRVTADGVESKS